jgi:hypothetical protein
MLGFKLQMIFSQKVEAKAIFCPMICCEVVQNVKGSLENCAVSIPPYDLFIPELISDLHYKI